MIYRTIGLMSGSSLDGLDISFVEFHETAGKWSYNLLYAETIAYTDEWRSQLAKATKLSIYNYQLLHTQYGRWIAEQINIFIDNHQLHHQVQMIASHGHTVLHHPEKHITIQIGDGASIAANTGINVVTELRNIDVALGGQGAPIVPMGEQLLFPYYDYLLNIGGIANITVKQNNIYQAFDICPANRILNMLANKKGLEMDIDGALAKKGKLIQALFDQLNTQNYYKQSYPKSLANEFGTAILFPIIESFNISVEDALHTYVQHIIYQLRNSIAQFNNNAEVQQMLITGGGALNKYLINQIQSALSEYHINVVLPDEGTIQYKEAIIVGLLGILRWREENTTLASATGAKRNSIGGAVWIGQEA